MQILPSSLSRVAAETELARACVREAIEATYATFAVVDSSSVCAVKETYAKVPLPAPRAYSVGNILAHNKRHLESLYAVHTRAD